MTTRELTKKHETVFAATIGEALAYYEENEPKGECVLVIEGMSRKEKKEKELESFREISVQEHYESYLKQGMDSKAAMKQVAKDRNVGKREIYQILLQTKEEEGVES